MTDPLGRQQTAESNPKSSDVLKPVALGETLRLVLDSLN